MAQPFADELHERGPHSSSPDRRGSGTSLELRWLLAVLVTLAAGLGVRAFPPASLLPAGFHPFAWQRSTTVNLYFADGGFLFPVSRRLPTNDQLPRAALDALLAGPSRSGKLSSTIPEDVAIRSFSVDRDVVRIDFSRGVGNGDAERMALEAIAATMTSVPGVTAVAVSVQGQPVAQGGPRAPLLYFPSADGLVAVPTAATNARDALGAYLAGPPASKMTGLPSDVRLLSYDYSADTRVVSLGFTYTPAVRALALEQPERTRMLLLGLIASLTEFPEVRGVRLDFGGQSRLGLGECSDLLRSPQPRPALLNDERLLD